MKTQTSPEQCGSVKFSAKQLDAMPQFQALACRLISRSINARLKGTSFSADVRGDLFLSVYTVVAKQSIVGEGIDEPLLQSIINKKTASALAKLSSQKNSTFISESEAEAARADAASAGSRRIFFNISIDGEDSRLIKEAHAPEKDLPVTDRVDAALVREYITKRLSAVTEKQRRILEGVLDGDSAAVVAARCGCTASNIRQVRSVLIKAIAAECA